MRRRTHKYYASLSLCFSLLSPTRSAMKSQGSRTWTKALGTTTQARAWDSFSHTLGALCVLCCKSVIVVASLCKVSLLRWRCPKYGRLDGGSPKYGRSDGGSRAALPFFCQKRHNQALGLAWVSKMNLHPWEEDHLRKRPHPHSIDERARF